MLQRSGDALPDDVLDILVEKNKSPKVSKNIEVQADESSMRLDF